jgi:Flp pilus assembly protein TadG
MRGQWRHLWRDKAGNFGIMTALLMVPLLGVAGLAIDFSNAMSVRTQLYEAADAAAVGALAEKSSGVAAAMAMGDGTVSIAEADAKNLFFAQNTVALQQDDVNVDVAVTKSGNTLQSTVNFSAVVPTTFLRVLGKDSIGISGTATSQNQTATYMDFYILVDNTPSMGVGATPTDIATMESHTPDSCAFACHETGQNAGKDYYTLAQQLHVTTRIDVVREATQTLTQTAVSNRVTPDQFRMAVYTFGTSADDDQLKTVSDLSDNMNQVSSDVNGVQLMTILQQNYKNDALTSFDNALTQLNTTISSAGQGTGPTDRQKILFFVTDGVGDSPKTNCTEPLSGANRCQEPIDTTFCTPLKNRNVKIAVLYTTYLPLPQDGWYNEWISPFQSQIGKKLQSCASAGLYFEVSPTQGISDAMNALFLKVLQMPRLTG